jgi:hypothetical protein
MEIARASFGTTPALGECMDRLGPFLVCLSLLALNGCASMHPFTKSGRADDEQARKLQWTNDLVERAQEHMKDGMPSDLEKLGDAYDAWVDARRHLIEFTKQTSYANQELGDCFTGKRRLGRYCKQAMSSIAEAEQTMAAIMEAALESAPSVTSSFPARQLAVAATDPALAKALNVEDAFAALAARQTTYFTRRIKKAGGAKSLVRKTDEGMCFVSASPHGNEVQPSFLFDRSADELFVRCVATDPLRSYERTQNDSIAIEVLGPQGYELVKEVSITDMSPDETSEVSIPMPAITRFAGREHEDWSHIPIQVRYVVKKKDRVTEVTSGGQHVRYEDHIDYRTVAKGVVVVQMNGASDGEVEDDEDDEDAHVEVRKIRPQVSNRSERIKSKKRRAR